MMPVIAVVRVMSVQPTSDRRTFLQESGSPAKAEPVAMTDIAAAAMNIPTLIENLPVEAGGRSPSGRIHDTFRGCLCDPHAISPNFPRLERVRQTMCAVANISQVEGGKNRF